MLNFLAGIIFTLISIIIIAALNPDNAFLSKINAHLASFQAVGSLAIAGSAIVAFFLYRLNSKKNNDDDLYKASRTFLEEAIKNLERAYEIFTNNGAELTPPKNSRLLWLTTARMIIRFQKLKSRITSPEHIDIIGEHEEYWRFQFYKLLDSNTPNFTKYYFSPSGRPYAGDNIARNSMAVIFSFSRWKEGSEDPMREVNDKELFAKGAIAIDQLGALEFLEDYEQYWEEVIAMRAEMNDDPS